MTRFDIVSEGAAEGANDQFLGPGVSFKKDNWKIY